MENNASKLINWSLAAGTTSLIGGVLLAWGAAAAMITFGVLALLIAIIGIIAESEDY